MSELNNRMVDAGGIMKQQQGPLPGNMTFYVAVDDLAAYRKKIADVRMA